MDNENLTAERSLMNEAANGPAEHIIGVGLKEEYTQTAKAIGTEQVRKAIDILQRYKRGKANLESKIIENEQFWKLRHWQSLRDPKRHYTPATGWLWNVIVSKHADMEDGYPEPNILPREQGDDPEAQALSSIVPVIMEQNQFHHIYKECCWDKLKQGAAIYGVFWDSDKLNGLGDIQVSRINAVNLFWEPGITDIQDSQHLFHTELVDNDILKQRYPQLKNLNLGGDVFVAKYLYDDNVDTSDKSTVVDWYYHKEANGKRILHYCKFVGDNVLYATENETVPPTSPVIDPATGQQAINPETGHLISQAVGKPLSETGLYDHGLYPFIMDSLYSIEGSPFGYGYTDICKETQIQIDQLNAAINKNALMSAKRRFFASESLDINLEEFADWDKEIIRVQSGLSEDTLREVGVNPLPGNVVQILNNQIDMLKEISGNRDVSNGGTTAGVTSASGIAALQEASSKSSRDTISTTYEAYKAIVYQVIELIRQFYDTPRQFRILGEYGAQEFIQYDNSGIKAQEQGDDFGIDMGYRVPQFDIDVQAQKASPYNKVSQNELALQFYNLAFFNPANATQAVACLDMMDFNGKDELIRKIKQNGTLLDMFNQLFQLSLGMAQSLNPMIVPQIMQMGVAAGVVDPATAQQFTGLNAAATAPQTSGYTADLPETNSLGEVKGKEHALVRKARERAQSATQPR